MTHINILKKMWNCIYDPEKNLIETINEFFHKDYEQCINGVRMNREEYIHHVIEQRKNITINTIEYEHILEKRNELFALYYPKGTNIKGLPIEAEVIAYFRFENKQVYRIHGQVRLIKGEKIDVDMKNQ